MVHFIHKAMPCRIDFKRNRSCAINCIDLVPLGVTEMSKNKSTLLTQFGRHPAAEPLRLD